MKSASALQRLKEARRASREQQNVATTHSAAASDADNEAYLQELDAAFQHLSHQPIQASHGQLPRSAHAVQQQHAKPAPLQAVAGQRASAAVAPCMAAGAVATSSSMISAVRGQGGNAGGSAGVPVWRTGPVDAAGVLVQVSERPLMCSATMADCGRDVVVGSSDHALYVVDALVGVKTRTLYSKTTGHSEWVTCVCSLPGGRVLSGGMDGRLWLWPSAGAAGAKIKAVHDAPVSKVALLQPSKHSAACAPFQTALQTGSSARTGPAGPARISSGSSRVRAGARTAQAAGARSGPVLAVSCSYDKTVKVWDVSGRAGKLVSAMSGHTGPVLELAVAPGADALLTGDRKGNLMCWDVSTASSGWGVKEAHAGHVTALAWQQDPAHDSSCAIGLSGGQDGCLKVWDGRTGSCIAQQPLHVDAQGKGAIGSIVTVAAGGKQLVVTAGADKTLRVVDPAASYTPLRAVQLTDFPYSLAAVGDGLVVCGCGDGSAHVVDAMQGRTLYALGAGRAAVRAMEVGPDSLVCSGDDGCVVSYQFL